MATRGRRAHLPRCLQLAGDRSAHRHICPTRYGLGHHHVARLRHRLRGQPLARRGSLGLVSSPSLRSRSHRPAVAAAPASPAGHHGPAHPQPHRRHRCAREDPHLHRFGVSTARLRRCTRRPRRRTRNRIGDQFLPRCDLVGLRHRDHRRLRGHGADERVGPDARCVPHAGWDCSARRRHRHAGLLDRREGIDGCGGEPISHRRPHPCPRGVDRGTDTPGRNHRRAGADRIGIAEAHR